MMVFLEYPNLDYRHRRILNALKKKKKKKKKIPISTVLRIAGTKYESNVTAATLAEDITASKTKNKVVDNLNKSQFGMIIRSSIIVLNNHTLEVSKKKKKKKKNERKTVDMLLTVTSDNYSRFNLIVFFLCMLYF
ncbi:MAG: hypothetical protein ACRYE7_01555 [Janthinobacterium lividum]